jgi:hypothetical protein
MNNELPQRDPWDQQSGEPNRWFARFERYRLAGPSRSLLGLFNTERQQRGTKKAKSIPESWAENADKWRWRQRAELWDDHERRQARLAHAQEIEEMNRRHAQESRALQSKGLQGLKSVEPDQLKPTEIVRFCLEAAKLERMALGAPETTAADQAAENGKVPPFFMEDIVALHQQMEAYEHARLNGKSGLPPGSPQEL